MFVRATKSFYISYDLICLGQIIDIDPAIAQIYITRGDAEKATRPKFETAVARPRKRKTS